MPGIEAVAERPDGSRVPFAPYPKLLKDAAGRVTGAVNVLVEIADRHESHIKAERLAAIVASSEDAIIGKDLTSTITSWNEGAERIFGYSSEEMVGQSILRLIPERLQGEELEIIAKLKRGERIDHFDTMRQTKNGKEIEVSITVSPIRDLAGKVVGASKVARDVTQRKQDEVFQQLLVEELNHRVKNTLAIVQSIASQSLRKAASPESFAESFNGRVQALARAHDLLVRRRIRGSSLSDIISQQVQLGWDHDGRIEAVGPEVLIGGRDAMHLALVLHELATNARKYGALAPTHGNGRLRISWIVDFQPSARLALQWQETGVVGITTPGRRGFGSTLIERSLEGSEGTVHVNFGGDGLECHIQLPLEPLEPQSAPREMLDRKTNQSRARVLVVEDEPLIALDLEEILVSAGFSVVGPAGSVAAAIGLIERRPVDVALLDANLGGYPVDDIAAALTRANIPFAFATGHQREGLPRSFAAARVLGKPFNPTDVISTVTELLQPLESPLRPRSIENNPG